VEQVFSFLNNFWVFGFSGTVFTFSGTGRGLFSFRRLLEVFGFSGTVFTFSGTGMGLFSLRPLLRGVRAVS
jgi:hypothetical protein